MLELLRVSPMTIGELEAAMCVTATAVRQRLSRLMSHGLVQREVERRGRGRPGHRYSLTPRARRQAGSNFADLARVLWKEIRAVKDPEVRRGLLARVAGAMAEEYAPQVTGSTMAERMQSVSEILADRRVPFAVDESGEMPVLKAMDCPYPELAEMDRGICAIEKLLFSQLLDRDVRLSQCRLDGHVCCQFDTTN